MNFIINIIIVNFCFQNFYMPFNFSKLMGKEPGMSGDPISLADALTGGCLSSLLNSVEIKKATATLETEKTRALTASIGVEMAETILRTEKAKALAASIKVEMAKAVLKAEKTDGAFKHERAKAMVAAIRAEMAKTVLKAEKTCSAVALEYERAKGLAAALEANKGKVLAAALEAGGADGSLKAQQTKADKVMIALKMKFHEEDPKAISECTGISIKDIENFINI
jgi:hypothetical protein